MSKVLGGNCVINLPPFLFGYDGLYQYLSVYNNLSFYANIYQVPHSEINETYKKCELT